MCANTFGGYKCSCSDKRGYLSSDNHTCICEAATLVPGSLIFIFISLTDQCSSPCKNGGKCVAFNRCSCLDGYTHDDCSVCMSRQIQSNLPMPSYFLLVCPPVELIKGKGRIYFRTPYVSRYTDLFCSWTIEAPPGKNVAFEVSKLTSHRYWCDRYVKVEISGGRLNGSSNDARAISICGDQPNNHRVVSLGNRLTVSFLRVRNRYGNLIFKAKYKITGIR